jgi:hypothetical protein
MKKARLKVQCEKVILITSYQPHGIEQVSVLLIVKAFTGSQSPAGDYKQAEYEHEENGARTDGHEGLEHETRVEVDSIEGADAAAGRVREELTVQQHRATYEIEAQEHGQRENEVDGHLGLVLLERVRRLGDPREVEVARHGMNDAYYNLDEHLHAALGRHGYAPVLDAIVYDKKLCTR